jgi:integrase
MSVSTLPIGSQVATVLRDTSPIARYTAQSLVSLQDLLGALEMSPPPSYSMLRSTVTRFSDFKRQPASAILIECLKLDRDDFKDYLRGRPYATNAIRSYLNYVRILAGIATKMGWASPALTIPPAWAALEPQIARSKSQRLVLDLVRKGRTPSTVQESDLEAWVQKEVQRGRAFRGTTQSASSLRRMILKAGYPTELSMKKTRGADYGVPFDRFPEPLKNQVQDVLRWKQDRFVPSRPNKAKVRPVTARGIQRSFERLYGFAVNVDGNQNITDLRQLVTEEIVSRFIGWGFEDRRLKSNGVSVMLGSICAALIRNPKYADFTQSWFPTLLKTLPEDPEEEGIRRKEAKFLPHEILKTIPPLIRRDSSMIRSDDPYKKAVAARDELLIQWLLVLPWRQRNLRECRVGGSTPNLFRGTLPALSGITKPRWLVDAESRGDGKEVWQFHFEPHETKTGNRIHCVLPRTLIPLLEEFLRDHRPHLVQGTDPGTLFLNNDGKPMSTATTRNLVSALTLRYAGRIVTPHMFRDIYAYMWLEKFPEDYLTVSKLLWHKNINTTINIYGRRFNESAALCRMESMLYGDN